MHTHIF